MTESCAREMRRIPIGTVHTDAQQPRTAFSGVRELAASIQRSGLLQPLLVEQTEPDSYLLVAGERRLRALRYGCEAQMQHPDFAAPWAVVLQGPLPVFVRRRWQLAENADRADLRPGEIARGLQAAWDAAWIEALVGAGASLDTAAVTEPASDVIATLEAQFLDAKDMPQRPSWEQVLADLGVQMNPRRRREYLRLLNIDDAQLDSLDAAGASLHAQITLSSNLGHADAIDALLDAAERLEAPARVLASASQFVADGMDLDSAITTAHDRADASVPRDVLNWQTQTRQLVDQLYTSAKFAPQQLDGMRLLCERMLAALDTQGETRA